MQAVAQLGGGKGGSSCTRLQTLGVQQAELDTHGQNCEKMGSLNNNTIMIYISWKGKLMQNSMKQIAVELLSGNTLVYEGPGL